MCYKEVTKNDYYQFTASLILLPSIEHYFSLKDYNKDLPVLTPNHSVLY